MTDRELWELVGEQLLLRRSKLGLKPFDVDQAGGPNYKTVQAIDRGEIARVASVSEYAQVVGLSLVDILRSILQRESEPLTPEAAQLLEKFRKTTNGGRGALLAIARELPLAGPEVLDELPSERPASSNDTPARTKPRLVNNGKRRK